ncbi:insulin-induced protein 1-like [Scleropages formosus]|uniref:Insulin-induced gene protein n=1 Tax=Scleropages formosus TaxID=113540 RepID=A0A0P7V927_SCLFO|nr:insulin-induced protein 1-like [Scleropages formosus]
MLFSVAAFVGLLYPCIDSHLGEPHKFKREWASVMRCIAVFVGINHASAKLDFANNVQLSMTLAALSLGLWWTFDRSRSGFGLGITIAFFATLITQFLIYNGVYQLCVPPRLFSRYTSPDFLYIRSWLPCIFFSGGVTVGNIGRQLAMFVDGGTECHFSGDHGETEYKTVKYTGQDVDADMGCELQAACNICQDVNVFKSSIEENARVRSAMSERFDFECCDDERYAPRPQRVAQWLVIRLSTP